ncbi:MAG TPA: hypothetical protein PLS12_10090 [Bacteroidales bacterium]|nr:hypothetical protein [Bacteroidales bacterium]
MLLPTHKRGIITRMYLQAALKPLVELYEDFIHYRNKSNLEATYNSQIMSLETYLRNLFGTDNIHIIDSPIRESSHVYNIEEEVDEPYIYQAEELVVVNGDWFFKNDNDELIALHVNGDHWFFQTAEDEALSYNTIVKVPAIFESDNEFAAKLQAALMQYIFSDKTYIIQYI